MKKIIILFITMLFCEVGFARRSDTSAYYMKLSGGIAESKKEADYIRMLLPPDSSNMDLIKVNDFYMNGKKKLIARSYINSVNMDKGLEGTYLEYYPTGKRKSIRSYKNGKLTGDRVEYYPNGKVYCEINYSGDKGVLLQTCYDSTGRVTAQNGNGDWVKYTGEFKYVAAGKIVNSKENGAWTGIKFNGEQRNGLYANGDLTAGNLLIFDADETPKFPGGDREFGRFLGKAIRYPAAAREQKKTGKVTLLFVVEADGTITNVTVAISAGKDLDDEALRAIKTSPKWVPGLKNGKPVCVLYNVPINFSLVEEVF